MARKHTGPPPEPKPESERVSWNVYNCAGEVGRWVGIVEAESGEAAILKAAERFGYKPSSLLVTKRRC